MIICYSCIEPCGGDFNFCPHCGYSEGAPAGNGINLPIKSILKDRYQVGREIGSGAFGVTYAAWDIEAKRKVAIKEYLPSEFATRVSGDEAVVVFKDEKKQKQFHDGLVKFVEEGEKLCKLPENKGVVRAYDCFIYNKTAYVVMEYLKGITLAAWLDKEQATLDADGAVSMLMPVISSLQLAHAEGLIHGDICPKNIFLTSDGQVKLVDFGAARFATTSHSRSLTALVAQGYSPEEQYRSTGDHGPHTDTYALGAVFYRLIKGFDPPDALERRMSLERHKRDIIVPLKKFPRANAIMNALNVRIEDRTANMADFATELLSPKPVKRKGNKIRAIDFGRLSARAKAAIIMLGLAICTAAVLYATGVIKPDDGVVIVPEGMTIVPSVENQEYSRAIELLKEKDLQYLQVGKEYSTNIPADYVLYQDLTAGSVVNVNTVVLLTVSGGPEMGYIPFLAGEDALEATLILEALGYVVRQEARFSQTLREGLVIGTSEKPGDEVPLGSTVFLYISQGPSGELGSYIEKVPDLIGLVWEDVLDKAEATGFMIEVIGREFSDSVPENHVISQSLTPGEDEMNGPDNPINVVMSLGPRVSRVPDVRLKTEQDAIAMLQAEGLSYKVNYENSTDVAKELVISQDPARGAVLPYGSTVAIIVSVGEPPFAAPNVVGMTMSEARGILTAAKLTVTITYEPSQRTPGIVLKQSVAAGAMVNSGDNITITVSSEDPIVEVPRVISLNRETAEALIRDAKLKASVNETYSETVQQGLVISQNPAGGTYQMKDSIIYLTVSKGPEPRIVPNLVNLQQSVAEALLRDRGLGVDADAEYSSTYSKGIVMSQSPARDSEIARGGVVKIVVSLGPEGKVPDVGGLTKTNAENILRAAGYSVATVEDFHPTVAAGNVMRQNPIAGATLKAGETVTITISKGVQIVYVPNVLNLKVDDARRVIEGLGLVVSETRVDNPAPEGTVLTQSPPSLTSVPLGSTVTITVSRGQVFPVAVNVSPSGFGSASATPTQAMAGSTVSLSATPDAGYEFVSWTGVPGSLTVTSPNTSFKMPANDVSVTANFRVIERSITYNIIPSNGGSVSGPSTAAPGSSVTIIANTNTGFTFNGWSGLPGVGSNSNSPYTFIMPDSNVTITANFAGQPVGFNVSVAPSSSAGWVSGPSSAVPGTSVTLTANPNSGYGFETWEGIPGVGNSTSSSVTFTMPSSTFTVTARFNPNVSTLSWIIKPPGSGTVSGPTSAAPGTPVTLTANPNSGFVFETWEGIPGVGSSTSSSVTFTMPANDVQITVNFRQVVRSINKYINPLAGGTISGPDSAVPGTQVTLTATADALYNFEVWTGVPNAGTGNSPTVTFTMPDYDVNITAHFQVKVVERPINVTVNPLGAGYFTGPTSAVPGTQVTLTAVPNSGFGFLSWDNVPAGVGTSNLRTITFTMPEGDFTMTANFRTARRISLAIEPGSSGTVGMTTPSQAGEVVMTSETWVAEGLRVTLRAIPGIGNEFVEWVGLPALLEGTSATATVTFIMPTNNLSITAKYK